MAVDPQKLRINRNDLAKFLPDPRSVRQFEQLMNNFIDVAEAVIAANTAAATANAAAATALTVADTVTADSSLANSFATGLTVTATDVGANVTVAVSAHTRVYGDGTSVAVNAGNVLALAYSTSYWIGYLDPTRAGGAVIYTASTSIQGNGTTSNYHFIGAVTTPPAAGAPVPGNPVRPPGFAEP